MKKRLYIKDILITILILLFSFGISLILQSVFTIHEHITAIFIFAVFLVSLFTKGYVYGIVTSFAGVIAVSWAFTFPYFVFDFTAPETIFSAIVMICIALLTSTLTIRQKKWEALKAEGEKERMRANLLRAVSHDLRTPLTTIYGASSAIIENHESLTDDQKLKMVQDIKEDSQWLIRMVENLLSVTRIDSEKMKIIKTATVLEELIDSVIIKFKKRYPTQKIDIDIPDDIVLVKMDAILIEQVIVNILENAVQHAKGMTRLSVKVFTLNKTAVFEISDNGCGIEKERLDKIFTGSYDSMAQTPDGQRHNAGIGLSVCATIIKAHNGTISAENDKNGGAIFRFTLDIEEEEYE